jgi:hypothetical protein
MEFPQKCRSSALFAFLTPIFVSILAFFAVSGLEATGKG